MLWTEPAVEHAKARALAAALNLHPVVARLLTARGLADPAEAEAFLCPRLSELQDPLAITNMPAAVDRVRRALALQQSVLIFGDYDVDGITSTAMLTDFLRRWGCQSRFIVPKRLEEGYGLSRDALERALADGKPDLLIAVDCGTGSVDEIRFLRQQGIDVLILDHHQSKDALPDDCILVNPHVHDPEHAPWRYLCAVGLVFKFTHAFLKVLRNAGDAIAADVDLKEYLDLVALGTIADLVQLRGENRLLVKFGLSRIRKCRRPGLCALMEVSGMKLGEATSPFDIGFKLGPRINASGRLDDASLPIQLLLSDDWRSAISIAKQLDAFNQERQLIERDITAQAESIVQNDFCDAPGLVLHDPQWHGGVVGIVASRISRKYHRPALVLAGGQDDGFCKGSGRSIFGLNLVETLAECSHLLDQWGGHPMAVGLSVHLSKLDALRSAFCAAVLKQLGATVPEPELSIAATLQPADLCESLLEALDTLSPFGQGNEEPVFALYNTEIRAISPMGNNGHLRFSIDTPNTHYPLDGVAWNAADNPPPCRQPVDLAVRFHWHCWRGRKSPRLTLIDWHPHQP